MLFVDQATLCILNILSLVLTKYNCTCTNTEKVTDLFKFAVVVKFLLNLLIQVANQCFTSILDKSVLIGQFSFTLPL